jgi:hypothetical protein
MSVRNRNSVAISSALTTLSVAMYPVQCEMELAVETVNRFMTETATLQATQINHEQSKIWLETDGKELTPRSHPSERSELVVSLPTMGSNRGPIKSTFCVIRRLQCGL